MAKAIVTFEVTYEVESTEVILDRMLNDFDYFYPSKNREEVWEKLAHWLGLNEMTVSQCDGLADLPNDAASAKRTWMELVGVEEMK